MSLYRPPLHLISQTDTYTQKAVKDALLGVTWEYFYTGKRNNNTDNIELSVTTLILDSEENIFLRSCQYTGQKHTWKEVIKDQLKKHLKNVGVEEGFANSEVRYFEASQDQYLSESKYELKVLELIAKVNRSRER